MTRAFPTYPHYRCIPHFFILRLIVVSPFAIIYFISRFITEKLERFSDTLERVLPDAYTQEWVEFDKLPRSRQREIERIARARDTAKERITFQTMKIKND